MQSVPPARRARGRRYAGIALVILAIGGLIAAAAQGNDTDSAAPSAQQPLASESTAVDGPNGSDTDSGSQDDDTPIIPRRVAPTVEVTFGSVDSWEGRPDTAFIGQQDAWTPQRIAFMQDLATQYKSKSTVALQGTLELFDREIDPSWAYPVWAIALEPAAAAELMGPDVGDALQRGQVVLNRTAAALRKADVGTSITLAGWDDPIKSLSTTVGMVVEDQRTADAEMLISVKTAQSLGLQRTWRVVVWDGDVRAVARDAASTVGAKYIDRSWTAKSVDSVLTPAQLKTVLGEFAVLRRMGQDPATAGDHIDSDPAWVKRNIVTADIPIIGRINCHRATIKPLQAVFTEIEQAGLASLVDVWDTRRAGGCWNPRLIRSANGTSGRNISRHSWGGALDINPSTNAYGATPTMDERIVDVFRRHGFAWGGTFPIADGMHFEFIGRPRVTGPPLPPSTTTTSTTTTSTSTTSTSTTTSTTTTSTTTSTTSSAITPTTSTIVATSAALRPQTSMRTGPVSTSPVINSTPSTAGTAPQSTPAPITPAATTPVTGTIPPPAPPPAPPSAPPFASVTPPDPANSTVPA